jgi:hypothetical protein
MIHGGAGFTRFIMQFRYLEMLEGPHGGKRAALLLGKGNRSHAASSSRQNLPQLDFTVSADATAARTTPIKMLCNMTGPVVDMLPHQVNLSRNN